MKKEREALKFCKKLIKLEPKKSKNHILYVQLLISLEEYNEALIAVNDGLFFVERSSWLLVQKNTILYNLGRFKEALDVLDLAVRVEQTNQKTSNKKYFDIWILDSLKVGILHRLKDYDGVIKHASIVLENDPNSYEMSMMLAKAYADKKMYKKAIETFKKIKKKHGDHNGAVSAGILLTYRDADQWDKALEVFDKLDMNKFDKSMKLLLFDVASVAAHNNQDSKRAIYFINKALKINPKNVRLLSQKAHYLIHVGFDQVTSATDPSLKSLAARTNLNNAYKILSKLSTQKLTPKPPSKKNVHFESHMKTRGKGSNLIMGGLEITSIDDPAQYRNIILLEKALCLHVLKNIKAKKFLAPDREIITILDEVNTKDPNYENDTETNCFFNKNPKPKSLAKFYFIQRKL